MEDDYEIRRELDVKNEKIGLEFLEKRLFYKFPTYTPVYDTKQQIGGVDFTLRGKDKHEYLCDLKVAASAVNQEKPLITGCLECYRRYKNKRTGEWTDDVGWFLQENKIANSIAILWVDKAKTNKLNSPEDILVAEVAIIKYDVIWDYLHKLGWDIKQISEKTKSYRGREKEIFKSKWTKGIGFSSSPGYYEEERPINILIGREKYKELSVYHEKYVF